jgi:predicted acylesterase/phospholipase RssA
MMTATAAHLVVSGAGALGAKQAAAIQVLGRAYQWRSASGASAGAINAAAVAFGVDDLAERWQRLLTRGDLEDWHVPGPWPIRLFGIIRSRRFGLMAGERIRRALVDIFGDKKMGESPMPLRIVVANLPRRRVQVVNSDDPYDADIYVVDALMCSLAVPFLIDAQTLRRGHPALYSDGGSTANVPAALADYDAEVATVVVRFAPDEADRPVRDLVTFAAALFDLRSDAANESMRSRKSPHLLHELRLREGGAAFDFAQRLDDVLDRKSVV